MRDGSVGIMELARPDKFNCLSFAVHEGIGAALDAFEKPGSGVRSVLVRAQGRHFCTGADLEEVRGLRERAADLVRFLALGHAVLRRLEASPLPIVAACQGLCLAGGLELMLACDVAFAARDAKFGDQHAQFGLVPGWGGSQRLPRLVGLRRALDLFYSARWLDAETAMQWGIVNHVVEPERLVEEALAYCKAVGGRSRGGITTMKRLARDGLQGSLADGLAKEARDAPPVLLGGDVGEGLSAFVERRKPAFES
ncbi:MAG: enoyl-CoA hydratase/isomerase family protein [Caldimonas sp.]